jgi:hypothetical protein
VSQVSTPPAAPPAARPEAYRLTAPVILWWAWLAFATANLVDVAIQGSARFALIVAAVLVTVTGVVYACALRPRVVADDAGLRVLNPVRDHRVPWGSVLAVDVGDWVRVHCAPGPGASSGKTIDSWALFVPARTRLKAQRRAQDPAARSRARSLPDEAKSLAALSPAQAIALQLDERAARERARGAAAGPPAATWAWPSLAAMAVPALALLIIVFA